MLFNCNNSKVTRVVLSSLLFIEFLIDQGSSWDLTLLPPGKLGRSDSQIGRSYSAKLRYFKFNLKKISHFTYFCH